MTDIVDRLRDKHCCDDACHCDEAAAEIERLRAACHAIAETLAAKEAETRRLHLALETANANCDRMAALAIDNAKDTERLRAALAEIAEAGVFSFGLSFDPDGGDPVALQGEQRFVLLRDVKAIADRARAALTAQPAAPGGDA